MATFKGIRAGDRVALRTPHNAILWGRAQTLLCFSSHVVVRLDRGSAAHPVVVDERNYVAHKPKR